MKFIVPSRPSFIRTGPKTWRPYTHFTPFNSSLSDFQIFTGNDPKFKQDHLEMESQYIKFPVNQSYKVSSSLESIVDFTRSTPSINGIPSIYDEGTLVHVGLPGVSFPPSVVISIVFAKAYRQLCFEPVHIGQFFAFGQYYTTVSFFLNKTSSKANGSGGQPVRISQSGSRYCLESETHRYYPEVTLNRDVLPKLSCLAGPHNSVVGGSTSLRSSFFFEKGIDIIRGIPILSNAYQNTSLAEDLQSSNDSRSSILRFDSLKPFFEKPRFIYRTYLGF
jgi:hypothetical protein